MKLFNKNIVKITSEIYNKYYSVKKHLVDKFPNMVTYVIPTTLKGIGKSYSIMNEIMFDAMNNGYLGLYLRWTKPELSLVIDDFQKNPKLFADKFDFEIEFFKFEGVTAVRRKDNGDTIMYFCIPSQFKTIKGLASKEEYEMKDGRVFWEEFLIPDGIYRKPKETIDSFYQVLGSLFRNKNFQIFMASNNTNPNNPFQDYLFTNMGWPEMGETIIDYDSKTVIDSPWWNTYMNKKYENTSLSDFAKLNPAIHKQLFGGGSLNDSIYNNQEMIIYRLEADVNFRFKFQIGIMKYTVYSYQTENGKWLLYITEQTTPSPAYFSGTIDTYLKTGKELLPNDYIKTLKWYSESNNIRYKSVKTMNIIQDWLIRYRDITKPIDYSKEKENYKKGKY